MFGLLFRLVGLLVFLVVVAGAIFLFVPAVGDVSAGAYGSALANEVDSDANGRCVRTGEGIRRCTLRSATFTMRTRDRRCFRAERTDGGTSPPLQRGNGCAKLRDQVRVADDVLDAAGL